MMKKLVLLVAVALFLAACGGDDEAAAPEDDPKAALADASAALGESDSSTLTFTLQSDEASLSALGEGSLTPDQANLILGSAIKVTGQGTNAQFVFNLGGTDVVDIRVVDNDFFARADVSAILTATGQDPAVLEEIRAQSQAPGFEFVGPALDGQFIAIRDIDQLGQSLGATAAPAQPGDVQDAVLDQLTTALREDATVTFEGTDEVGEHLVAQLPLRETVQRLIEVGNQLGGGAGTSATDVSSELPEGDIKVDAWINDGRLVQLEFDLIQAFTLAGEPVPEGVNTFALRVNIEPFEGAIEAPPDAVDVDIQGLIQQFFGGLGGVSPPSTDVTPGAIPTTVPPLEIPTDLGTFGDICESLKEITPPEDLKDFADICPEFAG